MQRTDPALVEERPICPTCRRPLAQSGFMTLSQQTVKIYWCEQCKSRVASDHRHGLSSSAWQRKAS